MTTLALHANIFEPGTGGVPSTTPAPDLPPPESHEHSIVAKGGFETLTRTYTVRVDEALAWLSNGLMRSIVAYGPEAQIVWEGALTQVEARFGQETRSRSLEAMQNRIRARYTTVLDTPGVSSVVSDTASQALYGIKDGVLSLSKTTAAAALAEANRALRERKNPHMAPTTEVKTGDLGEVALTLTFSGWYFLLDWLVTANTSTTATVTTAQVQALTTAYNAVNPFYSTDYGDITASGISDTEMIENDTTYRAKIESLLERGNSSNERLAWGIYEGRKWRIGQWAGATPTTITYQRSLTDGRLYDAAGNVVAPWDVRPDAMYQVIELLDPGPVATAQDAAARFYVERVTCRVSADEIGCSLEPAASTSLDATLARLT